MIRFDLAAAIAGPVLGETEPPAKEWTESSNPGPADDYPFSIAYHSTSDAVFIGGTLSRGTSFRLEKRSWIDGSLAEKGAVTLDSALYGAMFMRLIQVPSDGTVLFAAYEWNAATPGDTQWRVQRKKI